MKVDFFARRTHFFDHLFPIWSEIPKTRRGKFYLPQYLEKYVTGKAPDFRKEFVFLEEGKNQFDCSPPAERECMVTSAYGDMERAYRENPERFWIMMEHGVGLTFGTAGYAGGLGLRREVDLFLAPNQFIANQTAGVLDTPQVIIGTPKLDIYEFCFGSQVETGMPEKPIVCISFHWNGSHVAPEAGNAWLYFKPFLKQLVGNPNFDVIGHGHPKAIEREFAPVYRELGIPIVYDFEEVMESADIYVNDASSTMYEFLVTGKPVILMNAPWFRKNVHHGIRFWDYTDIGIQVDKPTDLANAILATIKKPSKFEKQRRKAVKDLYPNLGNSAGVAAEAIVHFTKDL